MKVSDAVLDYLQKFKEADSLYLTLSDQRTDLFLSDLFNAGEYESLSAQVNKARETREHYAVVLCRVLMDSKIFKSDIPETVPADVPEDSPADVPEDAPVDAPEDVPEADPDSPADAPEDVPEADPDSPADASDDIFPAMSAKCKLCLSCVDGRCFFVPDIYDSEFPCQSSAWDDFFKSGGSHGPAP